MARDGPKAWIKQMTRDGPNHHLNGKLFWKDKKHHIMHDMVDQNPFKIQLFRKSFSGKDRWEYNTEYLTVEYIINK